MALNYTDINTIKNWFKTGLKPTQTQFWSTWDSFWHKSESLPISSISGLGNLLDGKAETEHTHTEYATNDATSLTAQNITQWQNKLGINDLDYVVIPTEDATENSHPYVVVIDNEGNSARRNATDFGKVDTIDGIEADENKDVKLGAVRKSESNEVEAGFDLHQVDGASIGVDVNGVKVFKGGITATFGTTSIYVDNLVPDAAYKFQEILFPKRLVKNVEEKVYPVTYVNGVKANENGRVDISGIPWNFANSSIRYSGILDKSADATYNQLLGVDSNGYVAKVGLNAVTNAMSKSTDAQKDAWRVASLKSNEKFSVGQPRIDTLLPPIVSKEVSYKQYVTITGINLFINVHTQTSKVYLVKVKDGNGVDIQPNSEGYYPTEILIDNVSVNYTIPTQLSFGLDFSLLDLGFYKIRVINDSVGSLLGGLLKIVPSIPSTTIINPKYEYYDSTFNTLQETINAQNTQKTLTAYNTHYIKSPISFLKSEIDRLQSMIFDVGVLWSVQSGSGNYKVTVGLLSNTGLMIPLVTMDEGYSYVGKSYQLVVQIQNGIASVARFDTINFNKSIILTDVATSYTIYFRMYTEGAGASFTYNLNLTSYYKQE